MHESAMKFNCYLLPDFCEWDRKRARESCWRMHTRQLTHSSSTSPNASSKSTVLFLGGHKIYAKLSVNYSGWTKVVYTISGWSFQTEFFTQCSSILLLISCFSLTLNSSTKYAKTLRQFNEMILYDGVDSHFSDAWRNWAFSHILIGHLNLFCYLYKQREKV